MNPINRIVVAVLAALCIPACAPTDTGSGSSGVIAARPPGMSRGHNVPISEARRIWSGSEAEPTPRGSPLWLFGATLAKVQGYSDEEIEAVDVYSSKPRPLFKSNTD